MMLIDRSRGLRLNDRKEFELTDFARDFGSIEVYRLGGVSKAVADNPDLVQVSSKDRPIDT
jgi:hypothetical protein